MNRVVVVGLIAFGLAGCAMPEPDFGKTGVITKPSETVTVTPESLWQEYKANPIRAEETMKNKRVRMTGTLLAITPNDNKTAGLTFASNKDGGDYIFFLFPESLRPQVAELNTKQTVTVEGTFNRHDDLIISDSLTFDGIAIVK